MSLDRWDPFREMVTLRDAVDRLFQQSVVRPGGVLGVMRNEAIAVDISESEDEFEVRASVPGVAPDDLDIGVQGDTLTISGETHQDEERPGRRWIVREHRYGTFQRSITLPSQVEADKAQARFENGVVVITLPKAQAATPRRIPVGTAGRTGMESGASRPAPNSAMEQAERVGVPGAGPSPSRSGVGPNTGTSVDAVQGGADATAGGDRVTEASQESFPSSDPPSWTPEKS